MTKRTAIQKIEAKLRLLTAHTFMKLMHQREFRESFLKGREWDPTTPIVPALWSTEVGETKMTTDRYLENDARMVIVPVLLKDPISLSVMLISRDNPNTFWAENLGNINPEMLMEDVCAVLNPDKNWSTEDLTEVNDQVGREFSRLVDMT